MKKTNKKKGFTIVELVIVIAVIAILAAVLIPTFSNVIAKANENAAMQAARNEYEAFLAEDVKNVTAQDNYVIISTQGTTKYYFLVVKGQFNSKAVASTTETSDPTLTLDSTTYTKSASDLSTFTGNNTSVEIYKATTSA